MADHLIEMYDTGRSQWLWRCVKCKSESASALFLTAFTASPMIPTLTIAVAPDLLAALEAMQNHFGLLENNIMLRGRAQRMRMSRAAIRQSTRA